VKSVLVQPILSPLREIHVRMRIHSNFNLYTAIVILKDLIPISKKTDRISVTKATQLKLGQTVAVYYEIQTHELWAMLYAEAGW
jgi:hypothetical protein